MVYFILVFIIISILIFGLDRYFYISLSSILEFKNIDSNATLHSLGYYNKSIFRNKIYGLVISLLVSILIYVIYLLILNKKRKENLEKIRKLEKDLININKGIYSIDMEEDDEFSILRDEIYKIVVNLKSMEAEAKKQKLSLKDDLSNIAHQLKTPLTSIGFMAELIKEDRDNIDIYLDKLYIELDRLKHFTNILLKLSKVNSNTIEYKLINLSIRDIVDDILLKLNRDKKISVSFIGEDFNIYGDEVWLYEAFLNIIKNSLEHTKNRLEIKLSSNPIYKSIKISDNGKGLEEDKLSKIFDRFYRGEKSLKGYGIGLNMAKTIINNHKGEIVAYNDDGLTFEVRFYNV